MNTIHHFIGGKVVPGESGRKQAVFNPATGEQIGEVMLASKAEVDKAGPTMTFRESWNDRYFPTAIRGHRPSASPTPT